MAFSVQIRQIDIKNVGQGDGVLEKSCTFAPDFRDFGNEKERNYNNYISY